MSSLTWKDLLAQVAPMAPEALSEDVLLNLVERLVIDASLLAPYIQFKDTGYARNVLFRDEKFEAICLCWQPGQGTAIHNHGRSYGVVVVYEGQLEIESYRRLDDGSTEGKAELAPVGKLLAPKGTITLDRVGGIHRIANPANSGRCAVSLHFYAGPLDYMERFDLATQTVQTMPLQGEPMAYIEPAADVMAAMI